MTSPVEERLRAALAARAALVGHRDLRRADPPRGRRWGTHRIRAVASVVLGAAAAVAAVCVLALLPGAPARRPSARGPARRRLHRRRSARPARRPGVRGT
ncbi:hypothetical protein ACFWWN_37375, partial [Streptomyces sp. NPDC059082]|uniref:hypothetical protein n=1 Tax=Streptomyces sp. NPDC059082 TaxID=3346720 RepID=UPI003688057F